MHTKSRLLNPLRNALIALSLAPFASAQITDVNSVGFAGSYSNYQTNGPTHVRNQQNIVGPVFGAWSDETGIFDTSNPGIGTSGSLIYNVVGGHTGVYLHMTTQQTAAAGGDSGYVQLYVNTGTEDYITVTGYPRFTPVNVDIVFSVAGFVDGDYGASLARAFSVHSGSFGTAARLEYIQENLANGSFVKNFTQTATLYAGFSYSVFSNLTFSMNGFGVTGSSGFSTLDASHSANVRFYPQGAGAGITSYSGFDYTSPIVAVPEPATYATWAASLALVGALSFRRNRRSAVL